MEIKHLVAKLQKQFTGMVALASDLPALQRLKTGIGILDIKTGGGFPYGRTIEIYGKESSGKSWLSYQLMIQAQKQGVTPVLIDAEHAFDPIWVSHIGVDLNKLLYVVPNNAEEAIDILTKMINEEVSQLIVVDSIDALVPETEVTSTADKAQMAVKAKLINKALRVITSRIAMSKMQPKPMVVFINQMRDAMVLYGSPVTTPGGKGLRYYASIRLELSRGKRVESPLGKYQEVSFHVEKNKVGMPYLKGGYKLYVGGELAGTFDDMEDIISEAQIKGILEEGAWFTIGEERFHGKPALVEHFKSNPEKYEAFLEKFYGG